MRKSQNIAWIDILKAMGIILVIIGHNDTILTKYIYSFHMALFFFLSGITFNDDKWKDPYKFIKSRCKSLLIPYFTYSIFLYIIWIPLDLIKGEIITNDILIKNFLGIFYSQGAHEYMAWGIPMWFLTCLFLVSILYYFINKYFKEKSFQILILCGVIGYLTQYLPYRLPWSLDTAFTAVVFYGIGHIYKDKIRRHKPIKKTILVLFFLGFIVIAFTKINGRVDFYSNKFNNYILFYICSMAGIMISLILSKRINNMIKFNLILKFLKFIGKNTIPILAFHIRVLEIIKFISINIFKMNLNFNSFLLGAIILPILQILILIPIIIIINKLKVIKIKNIKIKNIKIKNIKIKNIEIKDKQINEYHSQ